MVEHQSTESLGFQVQFLKLSQYQCIYFSLQLLYMYSFLIPDIVTSHKSKVMGEIKMVLQVAYNVIVWFLPVCE